MSGGCEPSVDPQKHQGFTIYEESDVWGRVASRYRYATTDLWSGILDMTRFTLKMFDGDLPPVYETHRGPSGIQDVVIYQHQVSESWVLRSPGKFDNTAEGEGEREMGETFLPGWHPGGRPSLPLDDDEVRTLVRA